MLRLVGAYASIPSNKFDGKWSRAAGTSFSTGVYFFLCLWSPNHFLSEAYSFK